MSTNLHLYIHYIFELFWETISYNLLNRHRMPRECQSISTLSTPSECTGADPATRV